MLMSDFISCLTSGMFFFVETTSSSRIMNGIYDVPEGVRSLFNEASEETRMENIKKFYLQFIDPAKSEKLSKALYDLILSSDVSSEIKAGISQKDDPIDLLRKASLIAIREDNRVDFKKTIWNEGDNEINVISGDIISIGFSKKEVCGERIVVIPVDVDFTMKTSSSTANPLIAKDSLHGKWLLRMKQQGITPRKIKNRMKFVGPEGVGRIGVIKRDLTIFYLVALSELTDRKQAHATDENVSLCLDYILAEYDISGQGSPLFLPLMGTGRSRAGLTVSQSLSLIEEKLLGSISKVHGEMNVVVYRKDIGKLEAWNE